MENCDCCSSNSSVCPSMYFPSSILVPRRAACRRRQRHLPRCPERPSWVRNTPLCNLLASRRRVPAKLAAPTPLARAPGDLPLAALPGASSANGQPPTPGPYAASVASLPLPGGTRSRSRADPAPQPNGVTTCGEGCTLRYVDRVIADRGRWRLLCRAALASCEVMG